MDRPEDLPPPRVGLLRWAALAALVLLVARLAHIQFVRGAELKVQARDNSIVPRAVEADRGVIYDASGRQVVFNRPRFSVGVVTAALPRDPLRRAAVLDRLAAALEPPDPAAAEPAGPARPRDASGAGADALGADALGVDPARPAPALADRLPRDDEGRLVPSWDVSIVARSVPRDTWFRLQEDAVELPGVIFSDSPVREYPAGPTLAQVLGFTGSIPAEELATYRQQGYQIFDTVGRDGVERTYEAYLRGSKGRQLVEVDAAGREVRQVGEPDAPASGHSLKLTLELDFQQAAEEALSRGLAAIGARSGAVVALDPRDGSVRALVSLPNFDNNLFATGAKPEEFAALLANPDRPLVNRAVAGQYAPGSTFKMITASAALQERVVDAATRVVCPGTIFLTNQYDSAIRYPFVCWQRGGHGALNVVSALAQSCDVYFYEVAGSYFEGGAHQEGLGSERLARYSREFGLGALSGIELVGEQRGRVPTPGWLNDTLDRFWGTGETYFMGIGQGYTLVTPLQMANVAAAVANGGTLYRPHLVAEVSAPDGRVVLRPGAPIRQLAVAPEHLALVRQGMLGAVQAGTARSAWTHLPTQIRIGGKTGTAEFCDYVPELKDCRRDRDGNLLTHAWFTAFAPYDAPEIALAVFVDGSGLDRVIEGSQVAAPIAAEVLRAYFKLPAETRPATPCPTCPTPGSTPLAGPTPASREP
jgi:penicillin-binding protein 2